MMNDEFLNKNDLLSVGITSVVMTSTIADGIMAPTIIFKFIDGREIHRKITSKEKKGKSYNQIVEQAIRYEIVKDRKRKINKIMSKND